MVVADKLEGRKDGDAVEAVLSIKQGMSECRDERKKRADRFEGKSI